MPIKLYEGMGGWTIKIDNLGHTTTKLESVNFVKESPGGYTYFDIDEAMRQARALDEKQKQQARDHDPLTRH